MPMFAGRNGPDKSMVALSAIREFEYSKILQLQRMATLTGR